MGRQLLRFLKEQKRSRPAFRPQKTLYCFRPNQRFTVTTKEEPPKVKENYSKINEEDIRMLEGRASARMEMGDDEWIFDDPKYKVKPIIKPMTAPTVNKEALENELLELFSAKRIEPEANAAKTQAKKALAADNDEYMECYPAAKDYRQIEDDPELGEKVKELFQSEEQAKADQKWVRQKRKIFQFGGSNPGKKRRSKGNHKNDINKVEKVRVGNE